ncbi:MAG: peptide ABC transporter substrate-binding protein [Lachnospiraceae bacterium]|nr:peptide ABC transporter substrate-binding protein [Ruminococcus sp.]MCM1274530.1 peptide ABC transporter substrate-binding protein [Lachnospiraceae bacterium]
MLAAAGCREDDGRDYSFRYDISDNPVTLDPQIADDLNSNIVIGNVFTGLLTLDADGSVKEGVASDYSVSEDGMTYSFTLREDVYWVSSGGFEEKCVAEDFVYGFGRLFLPETRAPRASEYYCIENSKLLNTGMIKDASLLGVRAKGDYELEITLDYPNPRFLAMLAEPPAMPCSEKFFLQSQGKYGLSGECTPSNGSFYVRRWLYDPHTEDKDSNSIVLGRNAKNAETRDICPSSVTVYIRDKEVFVEDFLGGDANCISVSESERERIKGDFSCGEYGIVTCGIAFNRSSELFKSGDFCMALALLTDRGAILSVVSEFAPAEGIVPSQASVLGKSYRGTAGSCKLPEYDVSAARTYFLRAQPQLDTGLFTGARIIVSDSAAETAVSYVMQEWQREFGFYCVVEQLSGEDYKARLESGDYDIAVLELSGKYNGPSAYLEQFSSGSSENFTHFYDGEFEAALALAETAESSDNAERYLAAEQALIDKAAFIPLYCKNEYFFTAEGNTDILYDPFAKTVDFSSAKILD